MWYDEFVVMKPLTVLCKPHSQHLLKLRKFPPYLTLYLPGTARGSKSDHKNNSELEEKRKESKFSPNIALPSRHFTYLTQITYETTI